LTQSAVGWVLGCVFVRFLEDNDLLERPFLSGVGENRDIADETRAAWFREHRAASDNDYLAHVLREVGKLPGMADLMDARHNPLWNAAISPDAAKAFIEFWRRIDPATGKMAHEFSSADGVISNLKSQISNLKSQISNLKYRGHAIPRRSLPGPLRGRAQEVRPAPDAGLRRGVHSRPHARSGDQHLRPQGRADDRSHLRLRALPARRLPALARAVGKGTPGS
jgi:hypothetical protein